MSKPSYHLPAPVPDLLGREIRRLREARELALREVAAATGMDLAHLHKIEQGQRLPTAEQCAALARFFGQPAADWEAHRIAAKFWKDHADNPAVTKAVLMIQETAPAYVVNKSVNKRGKTS